MTAVIDNNFISRILSLRLLIPLLIVLPMLLLLVILFRQEIKHNSELVYASYQASQMNIAMRLQAGIESDVRLGLQARLQQYFSELSVNPEIRLALLIDEGNKVIASTRMTLIGQDIMHLADSYPWRSLLQQPKAGDTAESTIKQTVLAEINAIFTCAPVNLDSPGSGLLSYRRGKLCIHTDVSLPLNQHEALLKSRLLNMLPGFISLMLFIGLLLHWIVTRRMLKLLRGAQRVGEGKLNTVSGVSGLDEIGRLGKEFDSMVRKMSKSSAQLRKLSLAVEQSPNSIIITDAEAIIEYVNPHFSLLTGYAAGEVIGKNMRHLLQSGQTPNEVYMQLWQTITSGNVWRGELLNKSKSGNLYWEDLVISPISDEQGNITHFLSEQIDITARKQAEEQIRLYEKVFANANEAIMITDVGNNILAVNPAFTGIFGYAADEVIGRNQRMISSGLVDDSSYQAMWSSVKADGKWQGEVQDRRKNGETFAEWLSISALRNHEGIPTHYIALMSDISDRKAAEERMAYLAQYDVLTGLPNRILFLDRLHQAITYAERRRSNVALLFMDLDRFKNVNDTLGHHYGDLLLQEVTRRIRSCVRNSDTVSRQGGDEFIILLPNLDNLGDLVQVANKLIETISHPYHLENHSVHMTTSLGVSVYPQDGADSDALIKNADTAMYQAKDAGRNCFRFFTPEMNRTIAKRVGLENKLREALNREEFLLHYQPLVDLRSGLIVAAEALVRWQHPVDGMISPAEFIQIAEETGMIVPLGSWVLGEACRQNQEWRAQGLREISISVNLSPVQLHDYNLVEAILLALSRSGMPASALELEITESAMMKNPEQAIGMLNKLSGLGISFSIDDFGTGYSSLSYLKKFPVDLLKIDQSFVRDLTVDSDDAAIVKAVISMARSLGLRVIAEGVETVEQLRYLSELNCDMMQGYYFSRPVPAGEFKVLLESERTLKLPPA